MAPREGELVSQPRSSSANDGFGSAFWNRLNTLPMVQITVETTKGIYMSSKEKPVIGTGLGVLEYGYNLAAAFATTPVKKVASTIVDKYPVVPKTANKLDSLACNCLDTIENRIPAIQKSPTQIVIDVKKGTSGAIHSSVRRAMKTYPGQKVVAGLDSMINWSESTLDNHDEKEDEETEQSRPVAVMVKLRNGAVVPLKLYLQMLKMVKHMLANMAGVKTRLPSTSSPRKTTDLEKRRKVTPRKRLQKPGLVSTITTNTMSLLGLGSRTTLEVAPSQREPGSPESVPLGSAEKRKHDEESESESETESMNLASALDQYESELDSDYEPSGEPGVDDSLEYHSGDTESDLETEDAGINKKGEPLTRLKEKSKARAETNKPTITEIPPTNPENQPPSEN